MSGGLRKSFLFSWAVEEMEPLLFMPQARREVAEPMREECQGLLLLPSEIPRQPRNRRLFSTPLLLEFVNTMSEFTSVSIYSAK